MYEFIFLCHTFNKDFLGSDILGTNVKLEDFHLDEKYGKEAVLPTSEFLSNMNFLESGLSSDSAIALLHKNGLNELKQARKKKWYNYLFSSLFSPFNVILLLISLVLIYTDVILANTPSYANIVVILVLVIASTLLEFVQEYRSNKAALKLRNLVATTTTVLRDGKKVRYSYERSSNWRCYFFISW